MGSECRGKPTSQRMLSSSHSRATHLSVELFLRRTSFGSLECAVEKRERSLNSFKKVMVSYDVLGPGGRVILHAQTPFVQS